MSREDTGASGGMSPRRPQTRVRSGAFLRVWRLKSNSHRFSCDSHRRENDNPLKYMDIMTDSHFLTSPPSQLCSDFLRELHQGQGRAALGLVVGGDPDAALGLEGRRG